MKIFVTKDTPYEFCRSGADSFTVWFFTRPRFEWYYPIDIFGTLNIEDERNDWPTSKWCNGGHRVNGKVLRKLRGPVFEDLWSAAKFSYTLWDGSDDDLYEPLAYYYRNLEHLKYTAPGRNNRWSERSPLGETLMHLRDRANMKRACMYLEKEGQRWWEWMYEADVEIDFKFS